MLATVQNVFPEINLDDEFPMGLGTSDLTGGHGGSLMFDAALPALSAMGQSILVDIETRFDIQLEGDARILFRRDAPSVPSLANSVRFKTRAMQLGVR